MRVLFYWESECDFKVFEEILEVRFLFGDRVVQWLAMLPDQQVGGSARGTSVSTRGGKTIGLEGHSGVLVWTKGEMECSGDPHHWENVFQRQFTTAFCSLLNTLRTLNSRKSVLWLTHFENDWQAFLSWKIWKSGLKEKSLGEGLS